MITSSSQRAILQQWSMFYQPIFFVYLFVYLFIQCCNILYICVCVCVYLALIYAYKSSTVVKQISLTYSIYCSAGFPFIHCVVSHASKNIFSIRREAATFQEKKRCYLNPWIILPEVLREIKMKRRKPNIYLVIKTLFPFLNKLKNKANVIIRLSDVRVIVTVSLVWFEQIRCSILLTWKRNLEIIIERMTQ